MFDQPPEGAGRPVPPQPEPPSRAMVFTFGGSAESPPGKLEVQGGFAPVRAPKMIFDSVVWQ